MYLINEFFAHFLYILYQNFLSLSTSQLALRRDKLKISKIDYLKSKTIVSWMVDFTKTTSKVPYTLSLFLGIVFGVFVYFKNVGLIESILLSLACAFTVLGWWIMGEKRLELKQNENDSFILSHMGIIYKGKVDVFNGYSKGITEAKRIDNILILSVLKNRKCEEIKIDIPEEKSEEVDNFIKDLKDYFDGENNER